MAKVKEVDAKMYSYSFVVFGRHDHEVLLCTYKHGRQLGNHNWQFENITDLVSPSIPSCFKAYNEWFLQGCVKSLKYNLLLLVGGQVRLMDSKRTQIVDWICFFDLKT